LLRSFIRSLPIALRRVSETLREEPMPADVAREPLLTLGRFVWIHILFMKENPVCR
jgi:hypothetical protein